MDPLRFPDDLLSLQAAWLTTYRALAHAPAGSGTDVLRRRLIRLSCRIHAHPYWSAPGRSRAGGADLRRRARARGWGTAA
ncbi:hypothetical protein [Streptomyces sp. NPDC001568]|uniref:hypothetical protein n=1 Tax=Streptomyces sp. NPDC001568 TaxID=3364588 RepID=UPI0036A976E0